MQRISKTHMSYLRLFGPDTYGLNIPYSIAKTMEIKGLIEWVPPKFGTALWGITDKGKRAVRASLTSAERDEI